MLTRRSFAAPPRPLRQAPFLPPALWRGTSPADHGDVAALYRALYATGIDGLFSDFSGLAVAARDSLEAVV